MLSPLSTAGTGPNAGSGVVDNFSGPITLLQKRTRIFGGRKLPHAAILIDGSISPERDEAATWCAFYPVLFEHVLSGEERSPMKPAPY